MGRGEMSKKYREGIDIHFTERLDSATIHGSLKTRQPNYFHVK